MIDSAPVSPEPVKLDTQVDLLRRYTEAKAAKEAWAKIEELLRGELETLLGDAEEATVNGVTAVTWARTNTFQKAEFQRAEPELYRIYEEDKVVRALNVERLRLTRPEIFRQFQSRRFVNKFEV
jgi:hypothetical protein